MARMLQAAMGRYGKSKCLEFSDSTLTCPSSTCYVKRLSMAEILVVWMLGLIVIAIAWGGVDKIAVLLKTFTHSLQTPERTKRLQVMVASLFASALLWILTAADNNYLDAWAPLPMLLIWAGGIWLIPFRFDAAGHYWLSFLAIGVILVLFWMGSSSCHSTRTQASTDVSIQADVSIRQVDVSMQREQDTSTSLTGLGFLFWIALIGLTVAAIARYTSAWNVVALNS
ncbi:hypothetical protein [Nitrospira sp. BLG_2]|uniref:hypothetical protein n=1 Tax=Nitrospira sp. BLG_2 TaxID=3397507 RepID=UPI003B9A08C4